MLALTTLLGGCTLLAAAGGELQLDFDLDAGTLLLGHGAQTRSFALAGDSLRSDWEHYVAQLQVGPWNADEAAAWGARLLSAGSELLQAAPRWRIGSADMAGLDAIAPPWNATQPLLRDVELIFGQSPSVAARGEGILALQPFDARSVGANDAADTLDAALALAVRKLEHLPRNDMDAAQLHALFVAPGYELLSLRAALPLPQGWAQALPLGPPLRLWTWPGNAQCPSSASFAEQATLIATDATLLADRWPLSERARAQDVAAVLNAMQRGQTIGVALTAHKRQLEQGGAAPARWAGWILIGDADYGLTSAAPGRLRAWFRMQRARELGVLP